METSSVMAAIYPVIVPTNATVYAPKTGSNVEVLTLASVVTSATADSTTEIRIVNLTTGADSGWLDHHSVKSLKLSLIGGYGDLLSIEARNFNGQTAYESSAALGVVPAPSDTAPPDFKENLITASFSSGDFSVDLPGTVSPNSPCIYDTSFPATATLAIVGGASDSATLSGNGTHNTGGEETLTVSASTDDRAILTVEDNYGNRATLEFIVGQTISGAGWTSGTAIFHDESPNQVDSENAGTAGVIPVGDSGAEVTVCGQDLLYSVSPYSAKAPIVGLPIVFNYRSGIAHDGGAASIYDGPVGKGFDWNLDARLELASGDYYWYPGDGRRIGPFDNPTVVGSNRVYDSPKGIFLQLIVVNGSPAENYLVAANGSRWVFSQSTGLLIRYEDEYAYTTSSPPSDPQLNQIRLIRDDDDKVVQAILGNDQVVRFGWFHHDRVASIHHNDRTAYIHYHDDGTLSRVSLANGSEYGLAYVTSSSLLETVEIDPAGGKIALFDVSYDTSGSSRPVDLFETRDTLTDSASGKCFTLGKSGNVVKVTGPYGDEKVYAHSGSAPYFLDYVETRTDSADRSTSNGYPSDDGDPYAWRVDLDVDNSNYLVNERRLLTADTSSTSWTSATVTDWHEWDYETTGATADPRLRSRVLEHRLMDPSTSTEEFDETWTYGSSDDDFWPDSHDDFDGVTTKYSWNSAGQMTEKRIDSVSYANSTRGSYSIVAAWDYDSNGRVIETFSPDRSVATSSHGDAIYAYGTTSSSLDYGYRTRTDQQDNSGGATGPWREFLYDGYGNVVLETAPNHVAGTDNETEYTYDALNRVIATLAPGVTLEHVAGKPVIRHESETDFTELGGFAVEQTRRSYFNDTGTRGTGQNNASPEWLETDYTYDSATGRVATVESDFEYDSSLERTKREMVYDLEGRVIESMSFHSVGTGDDKHTKEARFYDAAGHLLKRVIDPNDEETGGEDPYTWWYRYDGMGRTITAFRPENSMTLTASTRTGAEMVYDTYGRVTKNTTGSVRLDPDFSSSTNVGVYSTQPYYPTGAYRAEGSDKYFGTTQLSQLRYEFDAAGRVKATETWYAGTATKLLSYAPVDLFPSGRPERQYVPWDGTADWDQYTETIHDSHDRVVSTQAVGKDGMTTRTWWTNSSTYDNQSGGDRTGWLIESERTDFDEVAANNVKFTTGYVHDEIGRVVRRDEYGTETSVQRYHLTRFNGMGQVHESFFANNVEGSFTENGVLTRTTFNFAGQPVDVKRGFDLSAEHSWMQVDYDLLGRMTTRTLKDYATSGPLPDRVFTTEYDDLGRTTELESPELSGTADSIIFNYGHTIDGYAYVDRTDAESNTARTLKNEAGQVLEMNVQGTSSGLGGAHSIQFTYGDGCGCGGAGKPVAATTWDGASTPNRLSLVTRTYNPLGQVLTDDITVDHEIDSVEADIVMETSFEYDAAGRRTLLDYPDPPAFGTTLDQSSMKYSHRSDGRVSAMTLTVRGGDLLSGATDIPLAEFEYVGARPSELTIRELIDPTVGTGADYVTIGYEYDPLGRLVVKDFDLHGFTGQFPDFTDEVAYNSTAGRYEFDLDGRILLRQEPPRTATQAANQNLPGAHQDYEDPTYSMFEYSGAGWLEAQSWGLTKVGSAYSGGTQQDYTLNHFGEVTEMIETIPGLYGFGNDYTVTIPYDRSNTNGQINKIPAASGTDAYQAITFDVCAAPDPGPQYADLHWYERSPSYDNNGRMESTRETIRQHTSCAQEDCTEELPSGTTTEHEELRYQNDWTYTYDVWGRLVAATQDRDRRTGTSTSCSTPVSTSVVETDSRDDEWLYDAYGRVVKTSLPVQRSSRLESNEYVSSIRLFHAYDGSMRIFSRDDRENVPASSLEDYYKDTFREVFRDPNTGQTLKFRNYRAEMGPSGDSSWPVGTNWGESYGTALYGIQGELLISNGNPDGVGDPVSSESVFLGPLEFRLSIGGYVPPVAGQDARETDREKSEDLAGGVDNDARGIGTIIPTVLFGGVTCGKEGCPGHGAGGELLADQDPCPEGLLEECKSKFDRCVLLERIMGGGAALGGPVAGGAELARQGPYAFPAPCLKKYSDCVKPCRTIGGLTADSKNCEDYGDRSYLGFSFQCMCKCMGDTPWEQSVRGCIYDMVHVLGLPEFSAHDACFEEATRTHGGRDNLRIGLCMEQCMGESAPERPVGPPLGWPGPLRGGHNPIPVPPRPR